MEKIAYSLLNHSPSLFHAPGTKVQAFWNTDYCYGKNTFIVELILVKVAKWKPFWISAILYYIGVGCLLGLVEVCTVIVKTNRMHTAYHSPKSTKFPDMSLTCVEKSSSNNRCKLFIKIDRE